MYIPTTQQQAEREELVRIFSELYSAEEEAALQLNLDCVDNDGLRQLIQIKMSTDGLASAKRILTQKMKADEVKEGVKYYANEALRHVDRAYYSDYEEIKDRLEIIENKLEELKTFLNL